jgi:hypothetical protein
MAKRDSNFNPIGKSRGIRSRYSGTADWQSADQAVLLKAITTASSAGGAVRLGYTRDGGAYAIGIYGDGDPYTVYCKPSENIDQVLSDIADLFESIADDLARAKSLKE